MSSVGCATDDQERLILAWSLGVDSDAPGPVSTTLGLFTVAPTDSGGGTEVSGGSYGRQTVVWNDPITDANGNTTISNSNLIQFPQATADWGDIAAAAIFAVDSNSVSRMIYHGDVYPVQVINNGEVFQVLPGDIVISID